MDVAFVIRAAMVVAMMADPPQRAILASEHAERRQEELKCPTRLKRAMRQQAMVTRRNAEYLQDAGGDEYRQRYRACSDDGDQPARQMQQYEGYDKGDMARRKPRDFFYLRHRR